MENRRPSKRVGCGDWLGVFFMTRCLSAMPPADYRNENKNPRDNTELRECNHRNVEEGRTKFLPVSLGRRRRAVPESQASAERREKQ